MRISDIQCDATHEGIAAQFGKRQSQEVVSQQLPPDREKRKTIKGKYDIDNKNGNFATFMYASKFDFSKIPKCAEDSKSELIWNLLLKQEYQRKQTATRSNQKNGEDQKSDSEMGCRKELI